MRTLTPRSSTAAALLAAALLTLVACGGDDGASDDSSSASPTTEARAATTAAGDTETTPLPITTTVRTEPGSTRAPATAPPTTAGPPTTPGPTPEPTTTAPCVPPDEQIPDGEDGAVRSPLVGQEIQTVDGGCFERVLITLVGEGPAPAARAEYASAPVTAPDGTVIEAPAVILLRVNAQMRTADAGYAGPTDIETANVLGITRLVLVAEDDGTHTWAIALTGRRDFRMSVRTDTTTTEEVRVVVDVAKG